MSDSTKPASVVPRGLILPFILVTLLFPLWGFANDITNPMVAAFKNILLLSHFESSLVQGAFYGGYALMAIPAALFIKRFSYKSGILLGLTLYATGCLLFIPSGWTLSFYPFLLAYLIMTSGLSFLETTANPYILSMGDERTATRRLNLSQAFNPMGSILGMFVASMFILFNLNGTSEDGRRVMQAVADGTPVHAQIVERQLSAITDLRAQIARPAMERSRRLAMRAMDQSEGSARSLAILANPQPDLATELAAEIAAQPQKNKFAEAAAAVAVVFKIRDPEPPTAAEAERDKTFFGTAGLELAGLLGTEIELLQGQPVLAEADPDFDRAAAAARSAADSLNALYGRQGDATALLAAAAGQLATAQSALEAANAKLAAITPEMMREHAEAARERFNEIQQADLDVVVTPYALMGFCLLGILLLFAWKLPKATADEGDDRQLHVGATLGRLFGNWHYLGGVIAQTFYVGAQIMCWTFIIQYAGHELGIPKSTAQNCNIVAMVIFVTSRFICTFLLHYFRPGQLLATLAIAAVGLLLGVIFIGGHVGLFCLIGVSACMSLMFPTIYGIALDGLGGDAKLASAGLILAIGGGCVLPVLQGWLLDLPPLEIGTFELSSVRFSFFLPLFCFVVIAIYGLAVRNWKRGQPRSA